MNHRNVAILFFVFLLCSQGTFAGNNSIQSPYLLKAEIFYLQSEFDSSLKYLNLAKNFFTKNKHDSISAIISNLKARIFVVMELRDSAIHELKGNYLYIKTNLGEDNEIMAVCNDIMGDYFMDMCDAEKAFIYYSKSLEIRLKIYNTSHPRVAYSFSNLARYHNFKISVDSAYYTAEKAYKIFTKNPEENWEIHYERIYMEYAYAYKIFYRNSGNLKKTLEASRVLYTKSLIIANDKYGRNSLSAASIYRNIGNTYTDILLGFTGPEEQRLKYFKVGLLNYDRSIAITTKILGKKGSNLSTLYFVKGLLYEYAFVYDSIQASLNLYDKAIQALIPTYQNNNSISDSEIRKCNDKYELMTILFTKSSCYWKAYNSTKEIEYLKQALLIAKKMVPIWNNVIEEFESPYANRLITIYSGKTFNFLVDIAWLLFENDNNITYLNDILFFTEQSKCSLQNRLLSGGSLTKKPSSSTNLSFKEIQSLLPDSKTVYIQYFDTTIVIGISKNNFIIKRVNGDINQAALLKNYQSSLLGNNVEIYQNQAYEIFKSFFAPILSNMNDSFRHMIVIPDGIISKVGIAGLVLDTMGSKMDFRKLNYVGQKYTIQHMLTSNDLFKKSTGKYNQPGSVSAFVPTMMTSSSLPFSKKLIQNLEAKVHGEYFLDEKGSKDNFLKFATNYRVIQLSTHAEADLGETMNSKLFFSDRGLNNNFITLDSIYKLKFNTQLAVLSACETNVGRVEYGEGSLNFSKAFLYAGCESTLTTQWKVDDKSTSNILFEFYNNLLEGERLTKSLQQAQLEYINNCNSSMEANPFYWSALIITGSDAPVKLDTKPNTYFYGLVVLILMLFPVGFWITRIKSKESKRN